MLPLLLLNDELFPELEGVVFLIPEGIFKHNTFVLVVNMTVLGVFQLHVEECDFLLKLTSLLLILKAALGKFPNLHFVVLIIEDLSFRVDKSYSQGLDLEGQSFDFYRLEHDHKVQSAFHRLLFVIRQIHNP